VIMVGEIRDVDTAQIAVQAALTGHLVFSTLHTNDAPSSVTRLVNMGVEPFLIAACLIGVMAQRLVRSICPACKEHYEPSRALLAKWGLADKPGVVLYRGKGCDKCKGTGYKGRAGLFELLAMDDELREMVISGASTLALRKKAQEKGMRLLSEDGVAKCLSGITTIEEVSRVCEERREVQPEHLTASLTRVSIPSGLSSLPAGPARPKVEVKAADVEAYQGKIAAWIAGRNK
jgi:type II secretory ATPase GspE/PulE/Tfp pilus assembly ATPase PilB-like protein